MNNNMKYVSTDERLNKQKSSLDMSTFHSLLLNNYIIHSRFLFKQWSVSVGELSADSCPAEI